MVGRRLGEIMEERGYLTKQELEKALQRQKEIFGEKTLPERLKRARLISDAREAIDTTPLLGQILTDMGFATQEQLEDAIREKGRTAEVYKSLNSEKLGTAIEIGFIVNSTLRLSEVLALIMRHAKRVTDSVASTLMLLDDESGELVFSVPTGPKAEELMDMRMPPGKGIAGWVAQNEQPALVPNVKEDKRFYPEIDKLSGFETQSILCVPLKAKAKLIGVLEVINKKDGTPFNEQDTLLLSIFAYQAAIAIEHARLYSELEDKMAEEIDMQKKLAESEKFWALGQMASGIAHDFNNLLMGIQGNASLMLLDIEPGHSHYEKLRNVEQSVLSGSELTKQLLGFARGGKYEVKPTNLNEIIDKSSRMLGRTKKDVKIHRKYDKSLAATEVDQGQIEQVLFNLFVNACQAMPGGGELFVQTENAELELEICRSLGIPPGKYVKVSVTDTGIGMDESTQKRVFDPFFTTKEMGRGTGLGLASAYGIIKNHGGIIDVYSEKGQGATFVIYLPATDKAVIQPRELPDEVQQGEETILLVDDEEMILEVSKEMLERLGYEVFIAKNGKEAVEIYKGKRGKIDVVILDMIMPDMGGGKTFDTLRGFDPEAKVLLSSGYSVDGQATEILERGCNGFIQKPFDIKALSVKIREILEME